MTVSQKAALSLLISVVLFAGFTVLAYTGLFDLVEAKFYNPSIASSLAKEVSKDADSIGGFLTELEGRFQDSLQDAAIKRSFLPNQSAEDIFERSRIYGVLLESLGGLQWVRFVDVGGIRLHYSTWQPDILRQDRLSTAYRNYSDDTGNIPYESIAQADRGKPRLIPDETGNRILFSLPFYDSFDVFRGTALFSLSIRAVGERLISEGRIKVGENISVITSPAGIVTGAPVSAEGALIPRISSIWNEGLLNLTALDSSGSASSLALISAKTSQGIFAGRLVDEGLFAFPQMMKMILLASFFLTVYLTVFLLFNLRQDPLTIVQNRLKQLQISLIEQYYDRKSDMDWGHWTRELEQRRDEIRSELKRGLGPTKDKDDIDSLIDKSWDELLGVIGGRKETSIDEAKLQTILNKILAAPTAAVPPASAALSAPAAATGIPVEAPAEEVEELTEAEPAEEVEELAEAEPAEEVEELTEAEPAEEVEELTEAEPAEEVEELTEAEPVEEVEELAEAEPVEEVEELAEAEPLEEVEELTEAEPVEEVEELTEAEPAEEVEELPEVGEGLPTETAGKPANADFEAPTQPPTNVKLVFGEDDIPYIVESSGLELVDEDIDKVIEAMRPESDEPAELEELEELEEGESGIAEEGEASADSKKTPRMSEMDLADLASKIEFSTLPDTDEEEALLEKELEIVSPFETMLSGFDDKAETTLDEEPVLEEAVEEAKLPVEIPAEPPAEEPSELESPDEKKNPLKNLADAEAPGSGPNTKLEAFTVNSGMSVIYKPFFLEEYGDPEELEAMPGEDDIEEIASKPDTADDDAIIEEREGVHYVNKAILDSGTKEQLNEDFKNLVDSIIQLK
ncbi:hypothetical protein [Leadbettera azotonutricia]|uniref:Uncharacterized protein n=1 Tax=Leadbettera azotonutricia (strain ATCC BAA-888 / DSM 13862 / ZAS-9) TaxID=545695 RepID=F5YCG8_LEAAZ|nr:hypothetical protein [Leadbettera azotonutricia]AEF83083.1 conserved hypothetical protein [Leadbettera azotonutricia ZAS-9]